MTAAAPRRSPTATLDGLAWLSSAELAELYAAAAEPIDVRPLSGQPLGRMLAVERLDRGRPGEWLRRLAAAERFPWGGKSFRADSAGKGRGINRVRLGGRHQLFPFETAIGPSELDGRPCVRLDYDLSVNPRAIRMIHDEVRAIEPGLYLGPAMLKRSGGARRVLWFALDTAVQAPAPRWG